MSFKPINLRVNHGRLAGNPSARVVDATDPVFSWSAAHSAGGRIQSSSRVVVRDESGELWDSGWREQPGLELRYEGKPFASGGIVKWSVQLIDDLGTLSEPAEEIFCVGLIQQWEPVWIAVADDTQGRAVYFNKTFTVDKDIRSDVLFICGIGYQKVRLNSVDADNAVLQPVHSDYSAGCHYVTLPEVGGLLKRGENTLAVEIGEGWRRNRSNIAKFLAPREVTFYGILQLAARLIVRFIDGSSLQVDSDESWMCGSGPIVSNDIFDGETYDARETRDPGIFTPAAVVEPPSKMMRAQTVEPIVEQKEYAAVSVTNPAQDKYVFDFGQNIAGVCRIRLPNSMESGRIITIRHAEILDGNGMLYTAPLRGAKATDIYIAAGDSRDPEVWQPQFTYHGFRYAEISGWPGMPGKGDISAIALYTDIDKGSYFRCGSPLVNELHRMIVQTERANLHGIATDCPQRDERMGWLNDATVRFEETPYNFEIGRMFPKIIADVIDAQSADGAITCTAPYVFGYRPADPVCSSFLVAGMQAILHTGNIDLIRRSYGAFRKWNDCLLENSTGYIVNYSHYGDWAGPQDSCEGNTPNSAVTPGVLMSTGYCYFNAKLLSEFAELLGDSREAALQRETASRIGRAFLAKWWDEKSGKVATGSQGCQAFALWLGILPEEFRQRAAEIMRNDVVSRGHRITTGNLCTRYLMDMLCEYGFTDDAWKLATREEYPSWGFMMRNGATTVWERFEMMKDSGMNSHCHPMYGAVGSWLYKYIAGIAPIGAGWSRIRIKPHMPRDLTFAEANVDTPLGDAAVKWFRQYGKTHLHVTVPFGATAEVHLPGGMEVVGSGFWRFERV